MTNPPGPTAEAGEFKGIKLHSGYNKIELIAHLSKACLVLDSADSISISVRPGVVAMEMKKVL